ncbi:MAG TPA: SusC/RagA family protein [Prolixibacteraceae bacterium]|nr:SusC/RagA family protein [Prolixibacteraceae bacterium]
MKKIALLLAFFAIGLNVVLAQTREITGSVTSADDGGTMPGVSISVKGTSMGTITDMNGKYVLKVPVDAKTLVFSFVGMATQEITIGNQSVINVRLEAQDISVDEVVVVGYGVQKKREVTGAISQVKGDAIANLATPSFESQLAGRSAGVQVTAGTGILGEAPRIRIRGIGSISQGTYPLVVVDGMPIFTGDVGGYASTNAMGDINPADIESVEILKDGSATAIYGSRAANGVILITTKKGSKGKFSVTYNNYLGIASPINLFDLLETPDFVAISNEKRSNRGQTAIAVGTDINTDWQAAVLRQNAFQQDHNLGISGATDMTNYYFSVGYTTQEGVSRPNEMNRYTFRSNIDQKVKNWLTIGLNSAITRSEYFGLNTGSNSLSGNIFSAIRMLPNTTVFDPNDLTGYNIDDINTNYAGRGQNLQQVDDNLPNIRYTLDKNVFQSKTMGVVASAYAMANITSDLNFRTQVGVDTKGTEGFRYWNPFHGDGQSVNGRINNNFANLTRWNWQNVLTYTKTIAEIHNINVNVVNEFQQQTVNSFYGAGTNMSDSFFSHNLIDGSYGTQASGGSMTQNGFNSLAGRVNYNYAQKYFFQASVRRDGISSLPKDNRYGIFPGVSVGWTISKESFLSDLTFISDFKVRASYAEVGNVDIGNYPYLGLYSNSKYADYNGIAFSQIGNDQLKWETSKKTDIGFDASFADSKYKFTFDYFINNQDGLILNAPTPPAFGIPGNSIAKNIGKLKNWGYEFSFDVALISNKNLKVSVDGNLSIVKNEVIELVAHQDILQTYTIIREGESIRSIFGYDYVGVNMSNGNPIYRKADGTLVQGNIPTSTYKGYDPANPTDISVASSLVSADRKLLGSSIPTYFGSVGLKAEYKGIDLNVMFRYSGGNYVMNRTRMDLLNQKFQNNGTEILGRWQSVDNPGDGWTPRLWYAGETFVNLTDNSSTRWVEKGDFIKLQTVTLGYTLPKSVLNKIGISNLRLFAQGQDLLMFTKYTGIDPEMESGGVDYNGTPRQSVVTFGINLKL